MNTSCICTLHAGVFDPLPFIPDPRFGRSIHPIVCCPEFDSNKVCFENEPLCPTYVERVYEDEYEYEYGGDYGEIGEVTSTNKVK